jgi:hypothetical protein
MNVRDVSCGAGEGEVEGYRPLGKDITEISGVKDDDVITRS